MGPFETPNVPNGTFMTRGRPWFAPYLLVASAVALILLLAPDSYTAFGLMFLAIVAGVAARSRQELMRLATSHFATNRESRAVVV